MRLAAPRLAAVLCLSMLAVFSSGAAAQCANPITTTLTAGVDDDFAPPTEPASPSAALAAFLGSTTPVFDQTVANQAFGHTFTGIPPGVVAAALTLRLRALGGNSDNDDLALEYIGSGRFVWTTRIAILTGMTWKTAGQEAEVTIDLASLGSSPDSLLPALADGSLDVYVEDDTAVDFMTLTVTSCPPPPPTTTAPACLVPPSGLLAWWPFDEAAGPLSHDIAGHHDALMINLTPIAGVLYLYGSQEVKADDRPDLTSLNFGAAPDGDFSIEVFLDGVSETRGGVTLVDKREFQSGPLAPVGYAFFLYNGKLALQLADGKTPLDDESPDVGFTNYVSGITVADGAKHSVAVTVDRSRTDGIRFYLEGEEQVLERRDPTLRGASLANSAPVQIGTGVWGRFYDVRIFDRVLSPAEVETLYQSDFRSGPGQCKSMLVSPGSLSMCPSDSKVEMSLQICNSDPTDSHKYTLTFGDPDVECSPDAGAGPATFTLASPDQNPLQVPAQGCCQVSVSVARPPDFQAGGVNPVRCFQTTANVDDGERLTATTSIWAVAACATPVLPIYWEIGGDVTTLFSIRNDGDTATTIPWEIQATPAASGAVAVSLDGLPPGDVVTGQVTVPAHGTAEVPVRARLLDFQPFAAQEIQLLDTRSGAVLASAGLRSFVAGCNPGPTTLCLDGGRFQVSVVWKDFAGQTGVGQAVRLTDAAGYFWFFGPDNVELVLKVLDGRPLNDQFWVFYGALSTVEYVVTVTDTQTGNNRTFVNLAGSLASVADTSALPGGPPPAASSAGQAPAAFVPPAAAPTAAGPCSAAGTALCLDGGRFRVEIEWQDFLGNTGAGTAVALADDAGYFWFFSPENVEVALKILDGSPLDPHWWVFSGGMSSVRYQVTVTDTATGRVKSYPHPSGTVGSFVDTRAFPQ